MEVHLKHKETDKVYIFDTVKDAGEFIGVSGPYVSRIMHGNANNTTDYLFATKGRLDTVERFKKKGRKLPIPIWVQRKNVVTKLFFTNLKNKAKSLVRVRVRCWLQKKLQGGSKTAGAT